MATVPTRTRDLPGTSENQAMGLPACDIARSTKYEPRTSNICLERGNHFTSSCISCNRVPTRALRCALRGLPCSTRVLDAFAGLTQRMSAASGCGWSDRADWLRPGRQQEGRWKGCRCGLRKLTQLLQVYGYRWRAGICNRAGRWSSPSTRGSFGCGWSRPCNLFGDVVVPSKRESGEIRKCIHSGLATQ